MGRWQPDARGRLEKAAMELYVERGFDETTVAEIAKREVLFAGAAMLQDLFVRALGDAAPDLPPVDAAIAGVVAGGVLIQERRDFARQRYGIIAANAELQERELIKLASLSAALADALRRRGVPDHAASLAAEVAIAVFRVAFERWVTDPVGLDLPQLMRESLDELRAVTADNGTGRPLT
jgi:hypothetical protein